MAPAIPLPAPRSSPALPPLDTPPAGRIVRRRLHLPDGARTTVHLAAYDLDATELRVAVLSACGREPASAGSLASQARLAAWCAARGVRDAIVGGFFMRAGGIPLGEIRTHGIARDHMPFDEPWGAVRGCVHVEGARPRIAHRDELPEHPRGDLLQAGPVLVRGGVPVYDRDADREGFSAGARQFDSDITDGRYPRAALGLAGDRILAVACDGRARRDAGLALEELASLLAGLGCETAINLDGGGSTTLVADGALRNRPRADYGPPEPGGRPVSTALLLLPRPA